MTDSDVGNFTSLDEVNKLFDESMAQLYKESPNYKVDKFTASQLENKLNGHHKG